ncbi:DUF3263 domain-containing protein [Microbacterium sp. gxy059]|uniref:DUF3263 domain-containing protein n=1 Tax=Microbacterium sp. gxy059 TaxID=2957199 RepID=UPI003D97BFEB
MERQAGESRESAPRGGLDETARAILALEAEWPRYSGAKEEEIRSRLGLPPARYYQLLGRLVDDPDALAAEPLLIGRLRRLRERRSAHRSRLLAT